jgi:hypothetical protein
MPRISFASKSFAVPNTDNLSLTLKHEVDLHRYPILTSHVLDGKPVVPFALMAEWLGHGALHENPGLFLHGLDDMRLFHGIKMDQGPKMICLLTSKPRKSGPLFEVDVEIRNGIPDGQTEMIHSRARAILTDKLSTPPQFTPPDFIDAKTYFRSLDEVYEKILFHGMALRGIKEILRYSSQGMTARIVPAPPPHQWIIDPLRSKWISDPLILDCAFQMAIIWCYEEMGVVSLPAYIASYRQYRSNFPSEGIIAEFEVREATEHKLKGDFTFLDVNNEMVARLTGYEAIMDASLSKAFKSKPQTQNVACG